MLNLLGEIGNGRATAIVLARQGAKVALVDHNVEWAQDTKQMIDAEGGISEVIQADVTSEESCKNAVAKTVELFGAVHILVNVGKSLFFILEKALKDNVICNHFQLTLCIQSVLEEPWAMPLKSIWTPGIGTCE